MKSLKALKCIQLLIALFGSVTLTSKTRDNKHIYRYVGSQSLFIVSIDFAILYSVLFFVFCVFSYTQFQAVHKRILIVLDVVVLIGLVAGLIVFYSEDRWLFFIGNELKQLLIQRFDKHYAASILNVCRI